VKKTLRAKLHELQRAVGVLSYGAIEVDGGKNPPTWGQVLGDIGAVEAKLRAVRTVVRARATKERRAKCSHPPVEVRVWNMQSGAYELQVWRSDYKGRCRTCRGPLTREQAEAPCCAAILGGDHADDCPRVRHGMQSRKGG